ncbi:hypothetical protein E0I26_13175 [Flavobacterium rhamnosiphilum]|uniref:Lipocalin-like domain-containing protein n=1 Tax=Flavobacterium rhamnosiphilum TaxID=2541724 RepID=A0A4R5F5D1_9FLAO|nr:hypothetical protein [Flavobacterium rhamnosiphilum]TDE42811.1 hypothetical protein E0I26_13175 [Flavobacterium rhamnosiphilum]
MRLKQHTTAAKRNACRRCNTGTSPSLGTLCAILQQAQEKENLNNKLPMKKAFSLLIIFILIFGCKAQIKEFSLLGKWKQIERLGNNGAKNFSIPIENGITITFENGNIITDKFGKKGTYEINGEQLHIKFPKRDYFYLFYPDKNDSEKMYLSPVTPEYQIICDEGCADVYEKIE